ncbi:hypothetical protein ACWATR_38380 [Nostoc sp. UIC 10890]
MLPLPTHQHAIRRHQSPLRKLRQQLLDYNLQSRIIIPAFLQEFKPRILPRIRRRFSFSLLTGRIFDLATIASCDHFSGFATGAAEFSPL